MKKPTAIFRLCDYFPSLICIFIISQCYGLHRHCPFKTRVININNYKNYNRNQYFKCHVPLKDSSLQASNPQLVSYFQENDQISSKGISVANIPVDTNSFIRGVTAIQKIPANDIVLSIPAALALDTTNNKPPSPFPNFVSQELWERSMWDHRIAYKLLYESKVLGEKSIHADWIKLLPKEFSTPFRWTDDLLEELQYPSIVKKIKNQRTEWKQVYDNFITPLDIDKRISFDEFVWALECVNSRTFSGSYEGSSGSERRSLFLFTGLLTLIWPILHLGTYEQSLGAAVSVGISIITRDLFISKALNLKRYVMCPYIDMINHNSSTPSEVSYNYFQDKYEVKSAESSAGDQIFISYGQQSNDRFLQYYGFIEERNPNDLYDFGENIVDLLLKWGERLDNIEPLPQEPAPAERLEFIARVLSSTLISEKSSNAKQSGTNSKEGNDLIFGSKDDAQSKGVTTGIQLSTRLYNRRVNQYSPIDKELDARNHFDAITVRCLRMLYASTDEWSNISQMDSGTIIQRLENPLLMETETKLKKALEAIISTELEDKSSKLSEDIQALNIGEENQTSGFSKSKKNKKGDKVVDPSGEYVDSKRTILRFRIAKKTLLNQFINKS